jgi:hypothetical protein
MYTKTIIVLPFAYIVASLVPRTLFIITTNRQKKPLNPSNKWGVSLITSFFIDATEKSKKNII